MKSFGSVVGDRWNGAALARSRKPRAIGHYLIRQVFRKDCQHIGLSRAKGAPDVGPLAVTNAHSSELSQPGEGPFHHPTPSRHYLVEATARARWRANWGISRDTIHLDV
jgi:hypothetical protein